MCRVYLAVCVDISVENCAICRGHIMDLCIECQDPEKKGTDDCSLAWGACNVILLIVFIVFNVFYFTLAARFSSSLYCKMAQDPSSLSPLQSRMAASKVL
jgi:hypothetical protein